MKVYKEMNLRDFQFWSGAKSNAETLTCEQLDMVESILEDCYSEGIDETTINDMFGLILIPSANGLESKTRKARMNRK